MRPIRYHALILPLLCLSSCEMPFSDDYFVEISHQDSINMAIDLNVVTDGEHIFINKPINLNYSLSAFGNKIAAARFKLGDQIWNVTDKNGRLLISEGDFPAGSYILSCELYVQANSGSLANQFSSEYYIGSQSWPVVIDYDMQLPEIVEKTITPDGFLQIQWSKPYFSFLRPEEYEISYKSGWIWRTTNIDSERLSYVDSLYAGEQADYRLSIKLEDPDNGEKVWWNLGSLNIPCMLQMEARINGDGSAAFIWTNPIRSRMVISKDSQSILITDKSGSMNFAYEPIQDNYWDDVLNLTITVAPYSNSITSDPLYRKSVQVPRYAKRISQDWNDYAWNQTENQLYIIAGNTLRSYRMDDMTLTAETKLESYYVGEMAVSPNSSLLAVRVDNVNSLSDDIIRIFKNGKLEELCRIQCNDIMYNGLSNQQLFYLTSDDKLVYLTQNYNALEACVCNALTGEKEKKFSINTSLSFSHPMLSPDGKWFCATIGNAPYLISLDNYEVVRQITLYNNYKSYSYVFNTAKPDELLCTTRGGADVWDLNTCAPKRTIPFPESGNFITSDPLNGNIAVSANNKLFVISPDNANVLFQTRSSNSRMSFFNNNILSDDGYCLDIQKYPVE